MNNHDTFKGLFENKELISRISTEFSELTLDVQEVIEHSKDPALIAVMLFKLAQERQKSNQLLEQINDKYDSIMLELKTGAQNALSAPEQGTPKLDVLPEQDQRILKLVEQKGQVIAREIQEALGYKGTNAASQRLNKLYKENHLAKVQSGKKVMYLIKH